MPVPAEWDLGGALWLRLSAFAYNELDGYARLPERVAHLIRSHDSPPVVVPL